MNNSNDLRSQMKLMKQKSEGAGLSGKDKARLLKSLREKEKHVVPVAPVPLYGSESSSKPVKRVTLPVNVASKSTPTISAPNSAPTAMSVSSEVPHQVTPMNYFNYSDDEEEVDAPPSIAASTRMSTSISSTSTTTSATTAATTSSLPSGFFDDASADYKARGLDLSTETAKQNQAEDELVSSFFSTLENEEEVNNLIEAAEEAEEENNDALNEAIQLAYQAKTATLLSRTERLLDKKKQRITTDTSVDNDVNDEVLHDISEVLEFAGAQTNNNDVYDAVTAAMAAKKQKKRKLQELRSSVIDNLDWMM